MKNYWKEAEDEIKQHIKSNAYQKINQLGVKFFSIQLGIDQNQGGLKKSDFMKLQTLKLYDDQTYLSLSIAYLCFSLAAKQGDSESLYIMGLFYSDDNCIHQLGFSKNLELAFKCFSAAAEKNHHFAINELGIRYLQGLGVDKNLVAAFKCFKKAIEISEQGDHIALTWLGECIWMDSALIRIITSHFNALNKQ